MSDQLTLQERCACGRPLHYTDPTVERAIRALVARRGDNIVVTTPEGSWAVQRHYIALHGLRAVDLPRLGFPRLFVCPRCGATSAHPDDVREGYCGACHDFTGREAGRWVDTTCVGCGRPVAADREGVERGATVLCTSCEPKDLPLR